MKASLQRVCVTGTGSFLPNEPVSNEEIDGVLGHLVDAPPRVQTFTRTVARRMLEQSGVRSRHFAVDRETHALTHTISALGEGAARRALEAAGRRPDEVELLLISSPTFDSGTPPTSALLQERLGIERCAEMEIHSNCSGVGKCVQVACDALRLGRYRTALVVYSQLSSVYLRSCYFNQPLMNKTQAALRYILADGSGALLLEARESGAAELPGELLGTFVESIGGRQAPAMTAGGGVCDILNGQNPAEAMYGGGRHHLDQDFAAVNRYAGPYLLQGLLRMLATLDLAPERVDHYVWSIPTLQLYNDQIARACELLRAGPERMKFRATHSGYCGGASLLIHLDEMVRSGELKRGQIAAVYSVESSKWMSAGFVLRW